MESIRETGELVFITSEGGTRTVRIPSPVDNITQFMVNTAANRIILANPFDATIGELLELKRSDRVIVSRIALLPAAS